MSEKPLRMLILGAHPDDAEYHAGGLASRYCQLGHTVKMVSVTDGSGGHHETFGPPLAEIRRQEAANAGQIIGAEYVVWDFPDGALTSSLAVRHQIIREIRTFGPDLVLTHRTNDYHPDHRAVGQAVQDASYLVTVPSIVRETPALRSDPVVAYMVDLFTKPAPLEPHVVLDATEYLDTIIAMLACHRSQVFEWLPYNQGVLDQVPEDEAEKMVWLKAWFLEAARPRADRFRQQLIDTFGQQRGEASLCAEAYEISEYASAASEAERQRLFPVA